MIRTLFLARKIMDGSLTSSISRWTYGDVTQFMELKHVPFLGLQAPPSLPLASEVFARVPLDKNKLMNDPKPTTHVDLPHVLAQVKLFPHVPNEIKRQYKADTLNEDDFDVYTEAHVKPYDDVHKINDQIIWKLRRACRAEENYTPAKMDEPRSTREKIIDTLAMDFAKLCGLDDDPLGISATGTDNDKKNEPLLPDARKTGNFPP